METLRVKTVQYKKAFAWLKIFLLGVSWVVLLSSVAYADDCLRDITRAED